MFRRMIPCLIGLYLLAALTISFFFLQTTIPDAPKERENPQLKDNDALQQQRFSMYDLPKRTRYPRRRHMDTCLPTFGRITVIVLVERRLIPIERNYGVAQSSLECYIRSTNYTLKRVDLDEDGRARKYCGKYRNLFFRKHCIVAHHLQDTDWMLVLDADTGVVNPNHCIEEWIDDRVDLIFYERFFDWEIMSGNYLVRNTPFARKFLMDWADMEFWQPFFSSADNGALQLHILKTVLPHAKIEIHTCEHYWNRSTNFDELMAYTTCVRHALGAQRIWPPKLRIFRRAHGFARDWFMTDDHFSEFDFMYHGWKGHFITPEWQTPFETIPNPKECDRGYKGWHWRRGKRISISMAKLMMADQERHHAYVYPAAARIQPHLEEPEVAECYPTCDDHI